MSHSLARARIWSWENIIIIIGIDPGVDGAAALVSHDGFLELFDLPSERVESNGRGKRKLDAAELANRIRDAIRRHGRGAHVEVWLEDVHAMPNTKSGSSANTSLMHTKGVIEGVVGALGFPLFLVNSRRWKGIFALGSDKAEAIETAQAIYPEAPITLKKHHNRAEACLVARYGLRERL